MKKEWVLALIKINLLFIVLLVGGLMVNQQGDMGLLNVSAMFLTSLTLVFCLTNQELTNLIPKFRENILITNAAAMAEAVIVLVLASMIAVCLKKDLYSYYSVIEQSTHILLGLAIANGRISFGVETYPSYATDYSEKDKQKWVTKFSWPFLSYTAPMIIAIVIITIVESLGVIITINIAIILYSISLFVCMYRK